MSDRPLGLVLEVGDVVAVLGVLVAWVGCETGSKGGCAVVAALGVVEAAAILAVVVGWAGWGAGLMVF